MIAVNLLLLMTLCNIVLAILMLQLIVPVWLGMVMSFGIMGIIVYIGMRLMMGAERPWK